MWDIELDLDAPSPPPAPATLAPKTRPGTSQSAHLDNGSTSRRKRPPSPVWDIELDLNESDAEEDGPAPSKKTRTGGFGDPLFLQSTP